MATINMGIAIYATYFELTAGSTSNIYGWDYQINGGSWVTIYPASTTSKKNISTTIRGLVPDTEYTIRVRARTTPSSQSVSYSYQTATGTTLRRQSLRSVNQFVVDAENPTITFDMVFFDNAVSEWDLCVYADETTEPPALIPFTGNTTGTYSVSVSSALANYIMTERMSNKRSITGTYDVVERNDPDPQGSSYRTTGQIVVTANNSGPVFTTADFEYTDRQLDVNRLLGTQADRGIMLQNASQPSIFFRNATARNGATIVSATATIEETTYTEEWDENYDPKARINMPEIKTSGEVTITARVTDSRGFYTVAKKTFNSLPYNRISFDSYRIARANGVEDNINANIYGTWSSISPAGTELNSLTVFRYKYKQLPVGSWSANTTLTPTTSSVGMFEFIDSLVSLSADYSYQFYIEASDEISTSSITVTVNKGIPLMSFRDGFVGVLTNSPIFPLDVRGTVGENGRGVLGYNGVYSQVDLNTLESQGIYDVSSGVDYSSLNYPEQGQGSLQVIEQNATNSGYITYVIQVYYSFGVYTSGQPLTLNVYARYMRNSQGNKMWSSWFKFTLT